MSMAGARMDESILELIQRLAPDQGEVRAWVNELRSENPGLASAELADYVGDKIIWTYMTQGAALSLPGVLPGLGTVTQAGADLAMIPADIALMVRNQAYLVFAIGECLGIQGREVLVKDTLLCLGLWANAVSVTKDKTIKLGTKAVQTGIRDRVSGEVLEAINKRVSRSVLTKYLAKKGGATLGKLIPFGVGVVVGGGFNYLTMKAFKECAMKYFSLQV